MRLSKGQQEGIIANTLQAILLRLTEMDLRLTRMEESVSLAVHIQKQKEKSECRS